MQTPLGHPASPSLHANGRIDAACPTTHRWPIERALFALAGTVTLLSVALVALLSPWFLLLTAFVGVNQWLYVIAGACPASLILRRFLGLRPASHS